MKPKKKNSIRNQKKKHLFTKSKNFSESKENDDISQLLDFLDLLLSTQDNQGQSLTDEEIRAEVDTFMFEGHDTTAAGISWSIYCLATNPKYQKLVQEEIDSVYGNGSVPSSVNYETVSTKFPFLEMCIKEAMRLYPPVPSIIRNLNRDVLVRDKILLKKGTEVFIIPYLIHRNPNVWENPEEYNPYRFDPKNEKKGDEENFSFIAFSAGNRNCIGKRFALLEEITVLSHIFWYYNIEFDESHPTTPLPHVILRPKDGIYVKLTKRR